MASRRKRIHPKLANKARLHKHITNSKALSNRQKSSMHRITKRA